jgi:hypothetical protein
MNFIKNEKPHENPEFDEWIRNYVIKTYPHNPYAQKQLYQDLKDLLDGGELVFPLDL